jgi:hypothetical protein
MTHPTLLNPYQHPYRYSTDQLRDIHLAELRASRPRRATLRRPWLALAATRLAAAAAAIWALA